MSAQGPGRKRIPNRDKLSAEDEALNQVVREAESRLAAKRAARAEAREIRMKELEKREKERYYGLDNKWGHIEKWMEDSERYSRPSRRLTSVSDEDEKMSVGSRGSFRPSDYSSLLSSSSRASSRTSSARASPVVEDRPDRDFLDKGSRTASTLSAATLASLGGASSRRGSCDTSLSVETEASIRDIKDSLVEAELKYRKAMVANVQLHNEKTALMYQVDTLREELNGMEELLWEARRQCDVTAKEFERQRQEVTFTERHLRDSLRQGEELLTEVCELRVRSRRHSQEVCDLQEALQWKEKTIVALERHRELSDVAELRHKVTQLRDLLKKHGVVAPNGELEKCTAEDELTDEAQEAWPGVRQSMLGHAPAQRPAEGATCPQDEAKDATWRTFKCSEANFTPRSAVTVESINPSEKVTFHVPPRRLSGEPDGPLPQGRRAASDEDLTQTWWSVHQQNPEEHGGSSRDEKSVEQSEDCEGQSPQDLSKKETEEPAGQEDNRGTFSGFSCSDVGVGPAEGDTVGERASSQEEMKNQRTHEEESPLVQKTNPECTFGTPPSSAGSLFVHRGTLEDWTGLDTMVQSILGQFLQNQSFVAEMRKLVLDQQGPQDHTKPLADPEGPVSAVLEDRISEDSSGSGSSSDQGAAGRTLEVTFRRPASEDQRNHDPDLTLDLVFVESYFAEPFQSRAEDCGTDQGSLDLDQEPEEPAGSPAEGLQEEQHHRSKVVFPVKKNDCDIL